MSEIYRARNRREAKRLACRLAAQELKGGLGCWDLIENFPEEDEVELRRFVAAMHELIEELDRRGRASEE